MRVLLQAPVPYTSSWSLPSHLAPQGSVTARVHAVRLTIIRESWSKGRAVSSKESKTEKARKRQKPRRVAQRRQGGRPVSSARFPPSSHTAHSHTPTPTCRFTGGEDPAPPAFFPYRGPILAAGGERSGPFLRGRSASLQFLSEGRRRVEKSRRCYPVLLTQRAVWRGAWRGRAVAPRGGCWQRRGCCGRRRLRRRQRPGRRRRGGCTGTSSASTSRPSRASRCWSLRRPWSSK